MTKSKNANYLYIRHAGPELLETPLLNKGSAFTERERKSFNLLGLLPPRYESIEEQAKRAHKQYSSFVSPLNKHIYLRSIQDNNETLFFRLVQEHIEEMMPIIYTPTVGIACEQFSDIYRNSRGLFISYEDRHHLPDILRNATKRKIKVIVVTDGERILGLGDQGIGGMGIPIGKLSLYTACGGISPAYTLPVMLDVGTNNQQLLDDPMYMGARHKRINQRQYDEFLEMFMTAIHNRWPKALLQFEDFAQPNAMPLLKKYRNSMCCFNDDIQGTAAVTLGTLLAATKANKKHLKDMKIVFVGAGSAGCGIAEMLIRQMVIEGLTDEEARKQVFMVDRHGLIVDTMDELREFQSALAQPMHTIESWSYNNKFPDLLDIIQNVKPDILIGVSGQPGLFTEKVIKTMTSLNENPIIFPLSNPSHRVESTPQNVIEWSNGKALVATGSPFTDVVFERKRYPIAQCNNSYIFPGIGLGVVVSQASRISDEMLMIASSTLAENSPMLTGKSEHLLPCLTEIHQLSKDIAFAVAKTAMEQNLALKVDDITLRSKIEKSFWKPNYRQYKRVSY